MIVGGNIAGYTRTMTTAIALETSKGDLAARAGARHRSSSASRCCSTGRRTSRGAYARGRGLSMRERRLDPAAALREVGYAGAAGARSSTASSFTLEAGRTLVLIGPNGAGKSLTLRLCTASSRRPPARVAWARPGDAARRQAHAMVFQRPVLLRRSARANILHALVAGWASPRERATTRSRCPASASASSDSPAAPPASFPAASSSALALARAWALAPEVLFLDEPHPRSIRRDPRQSRRCRRIPRARRDDRHDHARSRPGAPPRRRHRLPARRPRRRGGPGGDVSSHGPADRPGPRVSRGRAAW